MLAMNSGMKGSTMRILAIDPGPVQSGWVIYDTDEGIIDGRVEDNATLLGFLRDGWACLPELVIEQIASYGMAVGATVFRTCEWAGRFDAKCKAHWLTRGMVKMHLCGSMRAKDSNIRQALIDRFPATGGGKTPQIGTKACRGPLYGFKGDMWAALAVAVTWAETSG